MDPAISICPAAAAPGRPRYSKRALRRNGEAGRQARCGRSRLPTLQHGAEVDERPRPPGVGLQRPLPAAYIVAAYVAGAAW